MNRIPCRILALLAVTLTLPIVGAAADLVLTTGSEEIVGYVADVPCVSLRQGAPVEVLMEESDGVFRVYDASGTTYSASSLEDAVDGYLRNKGACVIQEIEVKGHSRISPEAIRFRLKNAPGDILHRQAVRKDIEEIYSMGYFETVDADFEEGSLVFTVKEYPVITSIEVEGNDEIDDEEIIESIGMKRFDILNTRTLKTSVDRIISLYREKGYYNVEVSSSTEITEGGIVLTFTVDENNKLYIKKVSFDGNENISDRKLRGVMETKNRWILGLFGHSGSYLEESLDTDLLRIEQYYGDQGYIKARAGRPQAEVREDKGIYITIPIREGPLFYFGDIEVTGDLIKPREELMKALNIKTGEKMRKSLIQQSVENLRNIYMDQGFAYVQVKPDMEETAGNKVNLSFRVRKGEPVSIDTIHIRGNTKTRDKVVRRELKLNEGDIFSSSNIQKSRDNLGRLGYFTNINIESIPKDDDTLSLLVDVEETTTGAFSFGVAYSSVDKLLG
ncbi:MAG: outer membrane protein assembly factor BamA, partial [Deltaproteobacteria bacterium]|nr:outer membrane protein assembly factor BamA [Deltaproteobacteria bacterium]